MGIDIRAAGDLEHSIRLLEGTLGAATLSIGTVETAAYILGRLQIWEAVILTPLVPILATTVLFIDLEAAHYQAPWKARWFEHEFRKSSFMVIGGVLATFGLATAMAAVSDDLVRVVFNLESGTSLICAGVYVVKRFA